MSVVEMPLRRLDICSCGHGVLLDWIEVGTVYSVIPETIRSGFLYRCGGCGAEYRNIRVIDANRKTSDLIDFSPLPYDLFCEAQ